MRYSGIVKDVSRGGLFVSTRAKASPGTALTISVAPKHGRTEIRVMGRVVRADRIHAHLAMQAAGGLGIEVITPGALGRLIGDLELVEEKPLEDEEDPSSSESIK